MTKLMRKLPMLIAAIFLIVQITSLSDYATTYGGLVDWRGKLFAIALESGVFGAAYWLRQSVTRKDDKQDKRDTNARWAALGTLIIFLLASAFLNTAKSIKDLPVTHDTWDEISAYVFGIVPTLFATVLGILQGFIDRLPVPPGKPAVNTIPMRLYAMADAWVSLLEKRTNAAQSARDAGKSTNKCPHCGQPTKNMGSHARWDCKKNPKSKAYKP